MWCLIQRRALLPDRDSDFIENWTSKTRCRYPCNLISKLIGVKDSCEVEYKTVALSKGGAIGIYPM